MYKSMRWTETKRKRRRRKHRTGIFLSTAENIQTNRFNTAEWMKNTAVNSSGGKKWGVRNDKLSGTSAISTGCERGMEAAGGRKLAQERLGVFYFFSLMRQRREKSKYSSFSITINYTFSAIVVAEIVSSCVSMNQRIASNLNMEIKSGDGSSSTWKNLSDMAPRFWLSWGGFFFFFFTHIHTEVVRCQLRSFTRPPQLSGVTPLIEKVLIRKIWVHDWSVISSSTVSLLSLCFPFNQTLPLNCSPSRTLATNVAMKERAQWNRNGFDKNYSYSMKTPANN